MSYKLVKGEMVPLTEEEEQERADEEAAYAAKKVEEAKTQYEKDRVKSFATEIGNENTFEESTYIIIKALVAAVKDGNNVELNKLAAILNTIDTNNPKPNPGP